eukprot:Colp12_sorted_trinity150504_noHs@33654
MPKQRKPVEDTYSESEEEDQFEDDDEDVASETESEDEGLSDLRKKAANIPFDQLQKLREKLGSKKFDQLMRSGGGSESDSDGDAEETVPLQKKKAKKTEDEEKAIAKRANKNRPQEISSKVKAPFLRRVIQVKKQVHRDPRFDSLSGKLNDDLFKKSYAFLDEIALRETKVLKEELKKEKDPERRREIQSALDKRKQEAKKRETEEAKRKLKSERNKMERGLVAKGKKPFFLKKSDERKLELISTYHKLKEQGRLDKVVEKRRRKNANKDHRFMPYERNV